MGMRGRSFGRAGDAVADSLGYAGRRTGMNIDLKGMHVVVTGGTGALGSAVVGQLLEAGAVCRVPWLEAREVARFPHRGRVELVEGVELTDEKAGERVYAGYGGGMVGGAARRGVIPEQGAGMVAYTASKAAVAAITRALAAEVAGRGILVN